MFSVVIPLYNKEKSIKNTITSVLAQTFLQFEIVIVNDGSTDASLQQVRTFTDPRIRLINKENGGVSSARNMGIHKANYDWIAFLDGDDLWKNNHLEEVSRMMKIFPNEKVYATSFEYSDDRPFYKHERGSDVFKVQNYFQEAIKEPLIWTSIVIIHKNCFMKVGVFNVKLNRGEDLDLWARIGREYQIIKSRIITGVYIVDSENKLTDKKFHLSNSMASIISLKGLKGAERRYFKNILLKKLKISIKALNFKEVILLVGNHNFELFK